MGLLLLSLMVVFAGCDAAKDAAMQAKEKAAGMADMANIDFGSFDISGLKEKITSVTDGFKDVTAENVDGLTSKISDLSGSVGDMGIGELAGPAKTAVSGMISQFSSAVTTALEGISDEGILGKLKPAVEGLMEKLKSLQ